MRGHQLRAIHIQLLCMAFMLAAGTLSAQEAPTPGAVPQFGQPAAGTPAVPPAAPAPTPSSEAVDPAGESAIAADAAPGQEEEAPTPIGDTVTLKNGKVLNGVQVVRESPLVIEVQVVPGVEPLMIPRKQIGSIEYDEFTAEQAERRSAGSGASASPGRRKGATSIELAQKLGKYVADEELVINARDVVEVLQEMASRVEANIEITPEVQQLDPIDREWTARIPAETSLMTVLRESLPRDFPTLDAEILDDRVRIRIKPVN